MSSKIGNLKFKRLKEYDTIWHPESTLVFKSATEKLVVGRYVDGVMIKLDDISLEICKEWKFKHDETLLTNDEEEDEEDEEENEDENEEDVTGKEENEVTGGEEEEEEEEDVTGGENEEIVYEKMAEEKEEFVVKEKRKEEVPLKELKDDGNEKEDFSIKFVFLNKYLNELSTSVDSHKKNTEKEIDVLKDDILKKNKEYDLLKNNYDQMEDQYIKLKAKFDGIKNFFS